MPGPVLWKAASGASCDEGGDDVAGVAVEVVACLVVAGGRTGVGMAGRDLHVPERDPRVEGRP